MADIELIIKIDANIANGIIYGHGDEPRNIVRSFQATIADAIKNGTPLDKHDEEVIAETVESIWDKPPYIDLLNKIRAEIENYCGLVKENHCKYCSYCNSVMGVREILEIIDKYREESDCHSCKTEYDCYECEKYAKSEE